MQITGSKIKTILFLFLSAISINAQTTVKIINGGTSGSTVPSAQGNLGVAPVQNIVGYGAVIDDATPINNALANALAACPTVGSGTGGNSCSILIPGGGVGAFLGPTSTPITPNDAQAHGGTKIQGTLFINSTLILNQGQIIGDCGGGSAAFVNKGCQANIIAPQVHGTLGSAVTSINTTVSVSPSFVEGGMANLPVGSAITIADQATCTASVTLSSFQGIVDYYTATCSSRTDIPPLEVIQVTGCANSAFDTPTNGASINNVDWYNNGATTSKISWYGPTGTAGSTTGCTVTAPGDWDTFETVEIVGSNGTPIGPGVTCATSVGQICFVPAYLHSSAAKWGEVAIRNPWNNFQQADIEDISVTNCWGVCIWMEGATGTYLSGVAAQPEFGQITGLPIELSSAAFQQNTIDHFVALASVNFSAFCGTANSCNPTSFPAGMLCDELPGNANGGTNANGCGGLTLTASNLQAGIWSRGNSTNTGPGHGSYFPTMDNVTIEQANGCLVTLDPRQGGVSQQGNTFLDNVVISDPSATGFGGSLTGTEGIRSYLCGTDPTGVSTGEEGEEISLRAPQSFSTYSLSTANKYWQVPVKSDSVTNSTQQYSRGVPIGIIDNGNIIQSELDGIDAGFGPSIIPYATLPALTSPSGWTCSPNCTVTTGVRAPDGSTNAGELDATGSSENTVSIGTLNTATSVGDYFIAGVWARVGEGNTIFNSFWGGAPYILKTSGTDTFQTGLVGGVVALPSGFWMNVNGEWWQPVIGLFTITTADATPHNINFSLEAPENSGEGTQFFQPFWMYIPASANVPIDEVERWRQQLMHGVVPQNFSTSGGESVTTDNIVAPEYEVLVPGTGAHAQISTSALGDWTDSGVGSGYYPAWNTGTSKWTPTPFPVQPLFGTTGTITGTSLTATCDSGTATVASAIVGHPVAVSSTTGADVGGAFYLRASVTSSNTVTVYVCGTGTPSSLAYNVEVF